MQPCPDLTLPAVDALPARCCLITVWATGPGAFAARAVLPDGTRHDFTGPFELARFLGNLGGLAVPTRAGGTGLR